MAIILKDVGIFLFNNGGLFYPPKMLFYIYLFFNCFYEQLQLL